MEEIKAQFETNFFGAVRVMQAIIPIMRKQRSGKIVNITSMGGRIAIPLDSIYHATEFALEGLSESIQYELEPFGIDIILIEPGAVGSNFWKNLKMAVTNASGHDNKNNDLPYRWLLSLFVAFLSLLTLSMACKFVCFVQPRVNRNKTFVSSNNEFDLQL
jgi:short-subunit dehydrogenase